MMITFHASKHKTTGVRKDAHAPCCARWRDELAVPAGTSCSDTSAGLPEENLVCVQKSTPSRTCHNRWRILTAKTVGCFAAHGAVRGLGRWGDAEVPLQSPTPRQPGCVPAVCCSTGRILHSCHTLLVLNPLPARGTGGKWYRWAQVTSQSLRAACHQPRFQFFWARNIQEARGFHAAPCRDVAPGLTHGPTCHTDRHIFVHIG